MERNQASFERYSRQTILTEIGRSGQDMLSVSRIAIVGLGATGGIIAELLTRAGVGHVRLIDRDTVELSNLQRQILYTEDYVGLAKADAAAARLCRVNSDIKIEAVPRDLHPGNIEELLGDRHLVMDGTDNIQTRFLINDFSVKHSIPWIYSGVIGTGGMEMAIIPGVTPCQRCLMPVVPPAGAILTCDTAGVMNTAPAIIASIATTDAMKILLDRFETLNGTGRLTIFDAWENSLTHLNIIRNENCLCCIHQQFDHLSVSIRDLATPLCGNGSVQINPERPMEIGLEELAGRLRRLGNVRMTRHMIRFRSGDNEFSIFDDGRAIVHGAKNEAMARALYARYIGE
jgi:molybdopterin/thiamine biosynthesis adenylyltransferase